MFLKEEKMVIVFRFNQSSEIALEKPTERALALKGLR